jgi:hypothetical protein
MHHISRLVTKRGGVDADRHRRRKAIKVTGHTLAIIVILTGAALTVLEQISKAHQASPAEVKPCRHEMCPHRAARPSIAARPARTVAAGAPAATGATRPRPPARAASTWNQRSSGHSMSRSPAVSRSINSASWLPLRRGPRLVFRGGGPFDGGPMTPAPDATWWKRQS